MDTFDGPPGRYQAIDEEDQTSIKIEDKNLFPTTVKRFFHLFLSLVYPVFFILIQNKTRHLQLFVMFIVIVNSTYNVVIQRWLL